MTGNTGSGKTAKIVYEMSLIKNRPFFVMGIKDLKLEHLPVPPVEEWTRKIPHPDDSKLLISEFTFPANAIVVIDEAQHVYRPRPAGSKVPDIVAAFETHRHLGIDFWLITQGPSLLDQNIRRLVKRHWHIHETFMGQKLLEWSQCRDPESKTDRGDAIVSAYKPPKSVFNLYHSADVHTAVKKRMPLSMYFVILAGLVFIGMAIFIGIRIKGKLSKPVPDIVAVPLKGTSPGGSAAASQPVNFTENPLAYATQFDPRVQDRPESALAYDAIRTVKVFPVVAGCIKTEKQCKCYSQQSTVMEISPARCADYISNKIFDPYREAQAPIQVASAAGAVSAQPAQSHGRSVSADVGPTGVGLMAH
jgi:zona occludens toxin